MNETENVDAVVSKKFKSSNENNEQTSIGQKEDEVILSKDRAKVEAGSYFLGPAVKKYVRAPVTQCLARKKGTDEYYLMKILELDDDDSSDRNCFMKRTIFHNEYSILTLLKDQPGVIQVKDFFKEYVYLDDDKSLVGKRVCMVLECVIPHRHYNSDFIPLNLYLKEDRLSENEALHIFYNLLGVLKDLHEKNVVHRDIRLSSIIVNRRTLRVTMIDFYYAKLLQSDAVLKCSQCTGYSQADFLLGNHMAPKANDMWAAGVILYAMLNGCLPFAGASNYVSFFSANRTLHDFYMKIMENDCTLTDNICISDGTKKILKSILCKVPQCRLTASQARDMVSSVLAFHYSSHNPDLNEFADDTDQLVPIIPALDEPEVEEESTSQSESVENSPEHRPSYMPDYIIMGGPEMMEAEVIESEVLEPEEVVNNPPVRESVIKRVSDYQPAASIPAKIIRERIVLINRDIKCAMVRLGATSVSTISALSFNYSKRRPF